MTPEHFITFYYTFVHSVPLGLLVFYVFRRQLRLSAVHAVWGYIGLFLLETFAHIAQKEVCNPAVSAVFQLIYAIYGLGIIRDYIPKIIAIGFLTIPLELAAYSIAGYIEMHVPFGWPYLPASFSITLVYAAVLLPAMKYIRRDLEPFVAVNDRTVWHLLLFYESIAIFITLLIDPFSAVVSFKALVSRIMLFATNLCCLYVAYYLCRNVREREYASHVLNSLRELQKMEQQRYQLVMEAWYASRRLRHDLQHHIVTVNALLEKQDYHAIRAYLKKIIAAFAALSCIKQQTRR